jgi:hypothetical protein
VRENTQEKVKRFIEWYNFLREPNNLISIFTAVEEREHHYTAISHSNPLSTSII